VRSGGPTRVQNYPGFFSSCLLGRLDPSGRVLSILRKPESEVLKNMAREEREVERSPRRPKAAQRVANGDARLQKPLVSNCYRAANVRFLERLICAAQVRIGRSWDSGSQLRIHNSLHRPHRWGRGCGFERCLGVADGVGDPSSSQLGAHKSPSL